MISKYSYLTAFMIVSRRYMSMPDMHHLLTQFKQLLGIYIGICLLGIPVYFLNRKVIPPPSFATVPS